MGNIIPILIIIVILGGAIGYIVHEKRKGVTCIGCPNAGKCSGHCSGNCAIDGCTCEHENEIEN